MMWINSKGSPIETDYIEKELKNMTGAEIDEMEDKINHISFRVATEGYAEVCMFEKAFKLGYLSSRMKIKRADEYGIN